MPAELLTNMLRALPIKTAPQTDTKLTLTSSLSYLLLLNTSRKRLREMGKQCMMQAEKRLPRNGKEGFLYGTIISTLTVLFMTTYSAIYFAGGLNGDVAWTIVKMLPIIWVIVMVIEPALIGRMAETLTAKMTKPEDSFNAKILFRILFTVLGMSAVMTLVGDIVGNGFHPDLFSSWLLNWPRNFVIVLAAESLVIQPIARFVMVKLHEAQDAKQALPAVVEE